MASGVMKGVKCEMANLWWLMANVGGWSAVQRFPAVMFGDLVPGEALCQRVRHVNGMFRGCWA